MPTTVSTARKPGDEPREGARDGDGDPLVEQAKAREEAVNGAAGAAAPGAAQPVKRKVPVFTANALQDIGIKNHRPWRLWVPVGMRPEDLEAPEAWVSCADGLAPYDTIEAVWEDASIWAEALVLDAVASDVRIQVLRVVHLPGRIGGKPGWPKGCFGLRAPVDDPQGGWWALRRNEGGEEVVLVKGCRTEEDARRAAADHATSRPANATRHFVT